MVEMESEAILEWWEGVCARASKMRGSYLAV